MTGFAARDREREIRAPRRPDLSAPAVRLAREKELDEIAALFEPGLSQYRGVAADWFLDGYLADLAEVRDRFGIAETYVALDGGRIVGSVAFFRDVVLEGWSTLPAGWSGFRALVVDPAVRGRGVGRLLVERCIERTSEVGAPTLGIHTVGLLEEAIRLYIRLGFVRCPEFDLRVGDVIASDLADDMVGLAFRYDL
jgi:GNAT superfamily N-acetyltransferase